MRLLAAVFGRRVVVRDCGCVSNPYPKRLCRVREAAASERRAGG